MDQNAKCKMQNYNAPRREQRWKLFCQKYQKGLEQEPGIQLTASSRCMEDTIITPAVPTSGLTLLNQNLLASPFLLCSEISPQLLYAVPVGFVFSSIKPLGVSGTNKQKASAGEFPPPSYPHPQSNYGKKSSRGRWEALRKFPVIPQMTSAPKFPQSVFGI